jgi:hypothetical protein
VVVVVVVVVVVAVMARVLPCYPAASSECKHVLCMLRKRLPNVVVADQRCQACTAASRQVICAAAYSNKKQDIE